MMRFGVRDAFCDARCDDPVTAVSYTMYEES